MLTPNTYRTIAIDPPWPGPGEVPAFNGGPGKAPGRISLIPYSTMTGLQIASLRIPDIATVDAQMFMWATSRGLGDAFPLLQSWGFRYRGLLIWQKPVGMGRHVRHDSEFVLWGARHGAPLVEPKNCPRQSHPWPRPKGHSRKPAEAYELFTALGEGPRIDIFARQARPGWERWGNEAPGLLETPLC